MKELIKKIVLLLVRLVPLQKAIVFESHPDFSDNSFALYEELLRRKVNLTYRIYWMKTYHDGSTLELPENVEQFDNQPVSFRESLRRTYILNTSKYIIDCNSFVKKRRQRQIRFHLGHGMPIKIDLNYSRQFGECDEYVVLSEFWKDIFADKILVPKEKLCYDGYPRNDVLVKRAHNIKWEESVQKFAKVIVWMPTYRQHRLHMEHSMDNQYPFGMPGIHSVEQLEQLHLLLKEKNVLLLYRPHPVQELSLFEKKEFTHICIANDAYLKQFQMTLYQMLSLSDGLITDYSSVYFDYLLTGKPIALTIEDIKEYFEFFTPAFDEYEKYIKGFYVKAFVDLTRFIEEISTGEDSFLGERTLARDLFHTDITGNSASKLADLLRDKYGMSNS